MGDFYEIFGDDAKRAAPILEIALTARYKGTGQETHMCGVPYHAIENYLPKLTKAGFRVAVCEQVSQPTGKGIVERAVTQVITPATTLYETILSAKQNNFLVSLEKTKKNFGIALLDLSTGEFHVTEVSSEKELIHELTRVHPSEIIFSSKLVQDIAFQRLVAKKNTFVFDLADWEDPAKLLKDHFSITHLDSFGIQHFSAGIIASARALAYTRQMQKTNLAHITALTPYSLETFMALDDVTLRNLEIFSNNFDGSATHSLVHVMDRTKTAMGGRMLRQWLLRPLQNVSKIQRRLDAVSVFFHNANVREALVGIFREVSDLQRLIARIGCFRANARDLVNLKNTLLQIPAMKEHLKTLDTADDLKNFGIEIFDHSDVVKLLSDALGDDPPLGMNDGGYIANGYNQELDELRSICTSGKDWILALQEKERQKTGIATLRIKFNKVFGYYIEMSKLAAAQAPQQYVRKQTLVNVERFIIPELKEYEEKVLGAEEKIQSLEQKLFKVLLLKLSESLAAMQKTAQQIATLDVLVSFASLAYEKNYTQPVVNEENRILIEQGRHPVIESLSDEPYVPNDLLLDNEKQQLVILTGPNMSGKSSYIRQNAIITLMAHIGSFVPAARAEIGLVDRIFTRVGASDNLARGQSTFMVEMQEAANIVHNATKKSLIIFDELGRGTSTYDGVSLAWSIAKYVHDIIGAKTLFATHYHELTSLVEHLDRTKNYSIAVQESTRGGVVFLHQVISGPADKSYGIEVAKLAGLPVEIIERAKSILEQLSSKKKIGDIASQASLLPPVTQQEPDFIDVLRHMDVNALTPLEALNLISEWKQRI